MKANSYIASLSLALLVAATQLHANRAEHIKQLVVASVTTLKKKNPNEYSAPFMQLCDEVMGTEQNDHSTVRATRIQELSDTIITAKIATWSEEDSLRYGKHVQRLELSDKEAIFIVLMGDFLNTNHPIASLRGHIERLEELMRDNNGTIPGAYQPFYTALAGFKNETNPAKRIAIAATLVSTPLPAHVRAMIEQTSTARGITKAAVLAVLKKRIEHNK